MLDCFALLREFMGILSIVDNGSSDNTLNIIQSYKDKGLPILLQKNPDSPHHGVLRTQAISQCTAPWIFYLDADETFTSDMLPWMKSRELERYDIIDFFKFSTIVDRYHFTEGGNGPSTRLFRNVPGVHFPQEIHTYPTGQGLYRKFMPSQDTGPWLFDHTSAKSQEALWAKGLRYQWAFGKVVGIGPQNEYIWRCENAFRDNNIHEFPENIKSKIFTGPSKVKP
jgi:glycosyltransferase involved in cell wall biosynthesis